VLAKLHEAVSVNSQAQLQTKKMKKDLNINMVQVISDFLVLGHVENIIAMFKQDKGLYDLTGDLLKDERFTVRLGIAVLFEELTVSRPEDVPLSIPSLLPLLQEQNPILRGEAATILGIIGSEFALEKLTYLKDDPDSQVREIISDILHQKKGAGSQCPEGNEKSS
jgi:hypothetical protein